MKWFLEYGNLKYVPQQQPSFGWCFVISRQETGHNQKRTALEPLGQAFKLSFVPLCRLELEGSLMKWRSRL